MPEETQVEETQAPEKEVGGLFDSIKDSATATAEDEWLAANDAADPDVKEEEQPAEQAEEPKPADEPEPEKAPEYTAEEQEAYEKSLHALRMDAVFDGDELDAMSREDILKKGDRAAKRQAKAEKALAERTARIKELEEVQATKTAEPEEPTAELDLSKLTQEERDAIPEPLLKVISESQKAEALRVKQAEEALASRDSWLEETTWELSRQRLWERFPQMKDADAYAKLHEKANAFDVNAYLKDGGGMISAAQGMLTDAAKMLGYTDTLVEAHRAESEKESGQRTNGSVSSGKSETTPPKAMSESEKEDWALDMIESGKMTPEEIKRKLSG